MHQNKKIIPISAIQKQGCQCVCMDGEVSAICSSTLDVPPICSPRICPVMPLSVEPIQSLRISPIGTSNCVQKQIYDDNLYRYKWQEVCY
ncbi:hypothetical protein AAW31_12690 [Nitrosomonas communis]|uniref:Uncharacterized protein n=1 Tax=Nitrosomonas communis TaxID=44574 RepID=A0A0F7KJG3_9PROT|nr:hypothetical protein AAW31_12690 [Nitrosomonas communis]